MASQDLIQKKVVSAVATETPSPGASTSRSRSGTSKPTFLWSIKPPYSPPITSDITPVPEWDISQHWTSLLSGTSPSQVGFAYKTIQNLRKKAEKEVWYEQKKEQRPERELWGHEGRIPGITTNLERIHLNTRRRNARPMKERRLLQRSEAAESRRQEVLDIAREELQREGRLVV